MSRNIHCTMGTVYTRICQFNLFHEGCVDATLYLCFCKAAVTSARHVKWSKNKVIGGTTSAWRGTRGLLASQTCMCMFVCVWDEYLLWPLSSNCPYAQFTRLGHFGKPCPFTHSNTIPALLQDCIFKSWTHTRNQDINQLVASTHAHTYTHNLKRVRRFHTPTLNIVTSDMQADLLWTNQWKPHPETHVVRLAYTVCKNNICSRMRCESSGR